MVHLESAPLVMRPDALLFGDGHTSVISVLFLSITGVIIDIFASFYFGVLYLFVSRRSAPVYCGSLYVMV